MSSQQFDCAVFVLGMHRSGTSALAGLLARCGFGLPENLIAPSDANERGFFESAPINELNNRLLSRFDQTWLSLAPITDGSWRSDDMAGSREELATLVTEEFASTRVPVIKDPRICRLFPLWEQGLDKVANDIRVIFIVRAPTEVASSLSKRNQIELEFGLLLWARYNLDAEHHSRHRSRCFLTFDDLLLDWRSILDKLNLPIDPAAVDSAAIDEFLSDGLRHHEGEDVQLKGVQLATELFEILSRWATDGEREADYPVLDALRSKIDEMGPVLGELGEIGRLERKRRSHIAAKSAAVEAQLASRDQQFVAVAEAIERSLREIDRRSEALDRQAQQLGEEFARSMRLVEEKDRSLRALAVENERLVAKVSDQAGNLEIANSRAETLKADLSEVRSEAGELDIELRSVKKKYRSTQAILQRERIRGKKLEGQVALAQARISELESGISLRLAKTIGSFGSQIRNFLVAGGANATRRQRERRLISETELFDASWYLKTYPDVAAARIDPVVHFADIGWREGRNPSAAFCTTRYLRRYSDVAELGINPLIHFIEHGSFEGREVHGIGELPPNIGRERQRSQVSLPPTLPVYSTRRDQPLPSAWLRACQLVRVDSAIVLDGLGLATASSAQVRNAFEAVLGDFETLSGGGARLKPQPAALAEPPDLQDGWFATSHRLITRWNVTRPTVIRALQVDPATDKLSLVGEMLTTGVLDVVEFDLVSPTMPLLFIAAAIGGDLLGARTLAFPSLLRGGHHYPELVAMPDEGSNIDPMDISAELECQLRLLRAGEFYPTVQAIEVSLAGADGTGPLFQRDLRDLLQRVLGVDVTPSGRPGVKKHEHFLQQRVELTARQPCRGKGGKLILAADMLPTLGILVSSSSTEASRINRNIAMSLIVSDVDPSQPVVRFDPPATKPPVGKVESESYPMPFPKLRGGLARAQLAAIRQLSRPLDDSEYLVPDMSITAAGAASGMSIAWLVDPGNWDESLLAQSIMALSQQKDIGRQRLLFTRSPSSLIDQVACSSFGSKQAVFDGIDDALAGCDAPLIGNLGTGIVAHDARTAAILASLLAEPTVSSASCVLVSSAKHGKSWQSRLVDGGKIAVDRQVVFGPRASSPTEMIWRATYAVAEPPCFWLARSDDVRRWRSGEQSGKETHLVTSVISASLVGEPSFDDDGLSAMIVPANADRSISAKVLVG